MDDEVFVFPFFFFFLNISGYVLEFKIAKIFGVAFDIAVLYFVTETVFDQDLHIGFFDEF